MLLADLCTSADERAASADAGGLVLLLVCHPIGFTAIALGPGCILV